MIEEWDKAIQDLVDKAKANKGLYPVHLDHCFKRIILDQLFQGFWRKFITKGAAKDKLTEEQFRKAIQLAKELLEYPQIARTWNDQSLEWRGKK